MVSNVSNSLKNKIINGQDITKGEVHRFIKYMIDKAIIIADRMYSKDSNYMNLFFEITISYNLLSNFIDNGSAVIVNINNTSYLVDIMFNDTNFKDLQENKYVELTKDNYLKYINLCGGSIE